ncbi:hypothetical protein SDC9_114770 [bioreactor metagenome]|uniref:Uncharacterized protein n=1 Tax=bioreactor metagenome TaxID=1076179 RepID=A0A645BRA4_9ZZZZ
MPFFAVADHPLESSTNISLAGDRPIDILSNDNKAVLLGEVTTFANLPLNRLFSMVVARKPSIDYDVQIILRPLLYASFSEAKARISHATRRLFLRSELEAFQFLAQ